MEAVNVFVRNDDIDEVEYDDIWDDELLIKAYNKSVKGIKQKIAQRMGEVNGTSVTSESEELSSSNPKVLGGNGGGVKRRQHKKKWEVGDYCRSVYSEDGVEYEARIINMLSDSKCVIQYCGYDNEEVVKVKHLKNSLGQSSRTEQNRAACPRFSKMNSNPQVSENCYKINHNNIAMPTLTGIPAVPPPPAFSLTSQFHQENESDALSAMLMSWYMSGYHTGYYQGLMQGKKQSQQSSNSNE